MLCTQITRMLSTSELLLTPSKGIAATVSVPLLLQKQLQVVPLHRRWLRPAPAGLVLAWGRKPSALAAEAFARRHQLPLLRLEDGFLRSVGLGSAEPPLSLVVDDLGIYYDAGQPSRLEALIRQPLDSVQQARAAALQVQWQQAAVSKYNHSRDLAVPLPQPFVLIADQTRGDASIGFGQADGNSFQQMLDSARQLYPHHTLVVKTHPDVMAGKKQGHFDLAELRQQGVLVLAEDIHPASLLPLASAVFCVTSQLGFEALLWQKPVHTFGMPFYAGWGLTTDALPAPARRQPVSLWQLLHAALIDYPVYLDPETRQPCEVERLINWLALQRREQQRLPARLYAVGFSWWKRHLLRQFVRGSRLSFVRSPDKVPPGADWLCWGSRYPKSAGQIRIEDGFVRSVGLGVALQKPLSWVFDPVGIYYDSTAPSQLEQILSTTVFSESLLEQAAQLQQQLLGFGITKYNLGQRDWQRPPGRRVVLVPGQVETDASIRLGSPVLKSNLELLRQVRQQRPDAYLVYKPHPDVQAGLRKAGSDEQQALQYCDELVLTQDMAHLLTQVDEVHTLTSLSGFEALLRGIPVCCYGQPFYAGWGLTEDWQPLARRQRRLTLPELIAGALLLYPSYFHPVSGGACGAAEIVTQLAAGRHQPSVRPWWRPVLEFYLRLCRF